MNFRRKDFKGLTLVEILIVLGIITILAGLTLLIINPQKQRARAQDAVLKNTIGSIGETVESFYGLYGYYPSSTDIGDGGAFTPFVKEGFTLASVSGGITFTKEGLLVDGTEGGTITYYQHGGGSATTPPCVEGGANENENWAAWAPGVGVRVITSSCSTADGYNELIN